MSNPVQFIDQPVALTQEQIDEGYECFCLDPDKKMKCWGFNTPKRDYYIIHEGPGGKEHPLHKECIKDWIKTLASCPNCRVPISNTLVSKAEIVTARSREAVAGAELAEQEFNHEYVYGTGAIASLAALSFGGLSLLRNTLSLAGISYGFGLLGNALPSLVGYPSDEVVNFTNLFATFGTAIGLLAWYTGNLENSNLLQAFAVIAFVRGAGLIPTSIGAAISGAASFGLQSLGLGNIYTNAVAGSLGILGAMKLFPIHPAILTMGGYTGCALAYLTYQNNPLLAATVGGMASTMTTTLIHKAYLKYKQLDG